MKKKKKSSDGVAEFEIPLLSFLFLSLFFTLELS